MASRSKPLTYRSASAATSFREFPGQPVANLGRIYVMAARKKPSAKKSKKSLPMVSRDKRRPLSAGEATQDSAAAEEPPKPDEISIGSGEVSE
jgi:hypothetical protein